MSTQPQKPLVVSFVFPSNGDTPLWNGGINYFSSLFCALYDHYRNVVNIVIFTGNKHTLNGLLLPENCKVIFDPVFERGTIKWLLNKLLLALFKNPHLENSIILKNGATIRSHGFPSRIANLKSISWITDFQHKHLPHFFSKKEVRKRDKIFLDCLRYADFIVVSSNDAAQDLNKFYSRYNHKVRILRFTSLPPRILSARRHSEILSKYQLESPYFFFPGQFWAHKNHTIAISALKILLEKFPDASIVCSGPLVDARNPDYIHQITKEIHAASLSKHFRILGVIPYAHIPHLMIASLSVINPSLFEGWSTTVEEAKILGVPLILSDINVHREQCQLGEALFFDPQNPDHLAACMERRMMSTTNSSLSIERLAEAVSRHDVSSAKFAADFYSILSEL
jgi:glycosyltransferase involved in cell wall biosynthesis